MIGDHQARGLSSQGISLHVCGVRPRLHQGEPRAGQSTSGTHLGRGHNTWREPPRRQTLDHPRGIVPDGLFARTLLDLSTLGQMHINRWAQHMGHRLPMHPVRSKATTGHWGTCSRFRKSTARGDRLIRDTPVDTLHDDLAGVTDLAKTRRPLAPQGRRFRNTPNGILALGDLSPCRVIREQERGLSAPGAVCLRVTS
jgi:hypothetical protein